MDVVRAQPRAGRVLVVDDQIALTRLATYVLQTAGYRVRTALSGEEALDLLAAEPAEIVLSDLGMGSGMNGWELTEAVRRLYPHTAVVLVTGWAGEIDPVQAAARGVEAVVGKPYAGETLRAAVEQVLTERFRAGEGRD